MDNLVKRHGYADAAIPYFWILDLSAPMSLVGCHLAGECGYQDGGPVTELHTTTLTARDGNDILCRSKSCRRW